jgi:hypothetical protein
MSKILLKLGFSVLFILLISIFISVMAQRNFYFESNIKYNQLQSGLITKGIGMGISAGKYFKRFSMEVFLEQDYANANDYGFQAEFLGATPVSYAAYFNGNSNPIIGDFSQSNHNKARFYSKKVNTGKEHNIFIGIMAGINIINMERHRFHYGLGLGIVWNDQQYTVEDGFGLYTELFPNSRLKDIPFKPVIPLYITYRDYAIKNRLSYSYGFNNFLRIKTFAAFHIAPKINIHLYYNLGAGLEFILCKIQSDTKK